MSTEEERLAKKDLEIQRLQAKIDKARKELYLRLGGDAETDQEKELIKQYKALDKKIERNDRKYWETSDRLCAERDRVFQEYLDV